MGQKHQWNYFGSLNDIESFFASCYPYEHYLDIFNRLTNFDLLNINVMKKVANLVKLAKSLRVYFYHQTFKNPCCCLPCNHCSNWTWVEEILAFGTRLRSTHCREFNYLKLCRPAYFVRTTNIDYQSIHFQDNFMKNIWISEKNSIKV